MHSWSKTWEILQPVDTGGASVGTSTLNLAPWKTTCATSAERTSSADMIREIDFKSLGEQRIYIYICIHMYSTQTIAYSSI